MGTFSGHRQVTRRLLTLTQIQAQITRIRHILGTFSGHRQVTRRLLTLTQIQAHFPGLLTDSNHVTTSIHSRKKHLPKVWGGAMAPLAPLATPLHLNISADELHLPAGTENPWTIWKTLNRLSTQVGRSRMNMLKWGFSNDRETCDCGIRQTMQHLLVCPLMDTACSTKDLTTANGIAIGCAMHCEGTI